MIQPLHVIVDFGSGIPSDIQGVVMLAMEKTLRKETGMDIEVFKQTREDDSKLRRSMTTEQRASL